MSYQDVIDNEAGYQNTNIIAFKNNKDNMMFHLVTEYPHRANLTNCVGAVLSGVTQGGFTSAAQGMEVIKKNYTVIKGVDEKHLSLLNTGDIYLQYDHVSMVVQTTGGTLIYETYGPSGVYWSFTDTIFSKKPETLPLWNQYRIGGVFYRYEGVVTFNFAGNKNLRSHPSYPFLRFIQEDVEKRGYEIIWPEYIKKNK